MMTDSLDGNPWFSLAVWLSMATVMVLLLWVCGADYSGSESSLPRMMFIGSVMTWAFIEVVPRAIDRLKRSWGI